MIAERYNRGLIVAGFPRAIDALDQLAAISGWRTLLQATPRRLRSEVLLLTPEFVLFWIDDERELGTISPLLAWMAVSQPQLRRVAVGYQQATHVEVALRNVGAHAYFATNDNIAELASCSLFQALLDEERQTDPRRERPTTLQPSGDSKKWRGVLLHSGEPP
jgi:hypothetical protein